MNLGWRRPAGRAAFIFIFITVLLDMLALGVIIPILPKLIERFVQGDTAYAAQIYGLFTTVWSLMQFLFSPLLGALSDRFGRRPVVLLSNLGLGLDYLLMAWAPTLGWLFLGRVLSGVTSSSFSTANAYIADITEPDKRAGAFGMLGAAFGAGFILGPALGGLLGDIDLRLPFWVAAGLSIANFLYGLIVLPESLPADRRSPFRLTRANPLGSLELLARHRGLAGLAAVLFLYHLAHWSLPAIFVLYANHRYGWDARLVGLTLAAVGICAMIVQAGLVKPIVERLGERRALLSGLAAGAVGFTIYGLAPSGVIFWLGIPVMSLWGLATPAAFALMSRRVSAGEQGRLQGANASLAGITGLFGPGLFTQIFAGSIGPSATLDAPGLSFLAAAACLVVACAIAGRATR
jgi:DHA1 family tetracycline resistance protein-like MFS transporter